MPYIKVENCNKTFYAEKFQGITPAFVIQRQLW